jgi:hypothetical protein
MVFLGPSASFYLVNLVPGYQNRGGVVVQDFIFVFFVGLLVTAENCLDDFFVYLSWLSPMASPCGRDYCNGGLIFSFEVIRLLYNLP